MTVWNNNSGCAIPNEHEEAYVLGEDGEIRELSELPDDEKAKISPSQIVGKHKPRKRKLKPFHWRILNLMIFAIVTGTVLFMAAGFLLVRQSALSGGSSFPSECPEMVAWWDVASPIVAEFFDTTEIAVKVTQAELPPLVLELQRIEREFNHLEYSQCTLSIRDPFHHGMRYVVLALEDFLDGVHSGVTYAYEVHFELAADALEASDVYEYDIDIRIFHPLSLGVYDARALRE